MDIMLDIILDIIQKNIYITRRILAGKVDINADI